jgi:hypothetical protein
MSNVGKQAGGARLGVRYNIKGVTNPTALLIATGPWGLVEYDVGPHMITPRLDRIGAKGISRADRTRMVRQRELNRVFGARGTYRGKQAMPTGVGVGFAYRVNHPGTTAKKPFRTGLDDSYDAAVRDLRSVITRAVVRTVNVNGRTLMYPRGVS